MDDAEPSLMALIKNACKVVSETLNMGNEERKDLYESIHKESSLINPNLRERLEMHGERQVREEALEQTKKELTRLHPT